MSSRWAFMLVLSAAVTVATTVCAGDRDVLSEFGDLCVATDGDATRALAAADAAQWVEPAMSDSPIPGLKTVRKSASGDRSLLVGTMSMPLKRVGTTSFRMCVEVDPDPQPGALSAADLDQWAGFPANQRDDTKSTYFFTVHDGVRTRVDSEDDDTARRVIQDGTLHLVMIAKNKKKAVLLFGVVAPPPSSSSSK